MESNRSFDISLVSIARTSLSPSSIVFPASSQENKKPGWREKSCACRAGLNSHGERKGLRPIFLVRLLSERKAVMKKLLNALYADNGDASRKFLLKSTT